MAVHATDQVQALRRAALWGMLAAKLWGSWGVSWDIQWHVLIGRDSFWIPPHLMTYSAVTATVVLSLGILARETLLALRGRAVPGSLRVAGLVGTPGMHLAWWGIAITVLAAPVDDLWHRLFGLDVTLWSLPHLLGFLGGQVNSVGCLLLAMEACPSRRERFLALVGGGAFLFGTFHLLIGPGILWAYEYGGLAFFLYPVLGALLLPVALVPVTHLSGSRWTPFLTVVLMALIALAGGGVAKAGFVILAPESQIEAAIAEDPTSPIAKAHQMARENRTPVVTATGRARAISWALLPALFLCLVEPRRRAVVGSIAFGATYLGVVSLSLAGFPALQPALPAASQVAAGVVLALAAGALGGLVGRWLARALEESWTARPGALAVERNASGSLRPA